MNLACWSSPVYAGSKPAAGKLGSHSDCIG